MRQRLSLQARALQLLAQREHSRVELRRKLLAHAERLAALDDAPPGAAAGADAGGQAQPVAGPDADPALGPRGVSRTRRAGAPARTQAQVDALLDALEASGALSESRFVETRVRLLAARQGNLRIVQELARHGIELAPDAAQDLKASELARAKEVFGRRFGTPAADAAGRARQMRFLAARGFSADVVRRLLRGVDDDD